MATIGTLTTLQTAAALQLIKGLGLGVNEEFASNISAYNANPLSNKGYYIADVVAWVSNGANISNIGNASATTYRFGSYYANVNSQTLGRNTIPAITQVMPGNISTITGQTLYHTANAVNRVFGSNSSIDVPHFLMLYSMAVGFTDSVNRYITAINTSNVTTFSNLGVTNYKGLISQGWDKYQTGSALKAAFANIGDMTDSLSTGKFGTPGAVAQVLISKGLGNTTGLTSSLTSANVNLADLTNPRYELAITQVLSSINSTTANQKLAVVQQTIGSNIRNMTSLMDYTSISACAGVANDSSFETFANVGADIYKKAHSPTFTNGSDVANLIGLIQSPDYSGVEAIAGNGTLLSTSVITELRSYLPVSSANSTISVTDVIGTPSGYYNANLAAVVEGLSELNSTSYGSQILVALDDIYDTMVEAALYAVDPNVSLSAPYYGVVSDAINGYDTLLTTILNDQSVSTIVEKINSNYFDLCSRLVIEKSNWTKAKFITGSYDDLMTYLSFVQSLPQYAQDTENTGSGVMINGVIQTTDPGQILRSVLIEAKNYQRVSYYGIRPNGYVG